MRIYPRDKEKLGREVDLAIAVLSLLFFLYFLFEKAVENGYI